MENLAEKYQREMETSDNVGALLARFYCEALHKTNSVNIIIMFNKLVAMYGRLATFNAILSIYDIADKVEFENVYSLLAYFCKKEIIKTEDNSVDLTEIIIKREQKLEKLRNRQLKIPNPFKKDSK